MHSAVLSHVPLWFGMLPDNPDFGDSFSYQMTGLMVVFTALGMIWLALTIVGAYFKRNAAAAAAAAKAKAAAEAAEATSLAPAASDELTPETVAVIAASVQVCLEGHYRIQAIVPLRPTQDWAHEGRRRIFASHRVKR